MKKVACLLGVILLCSGMASAYEIKCACPKEVYRGDIVTIEGTSTLPPGYSTWIQLYEVQPVARELTSQSLVIQQDGTWSIQLQTAGLEEGTYKFEIEEDIMDYPLSSGSDRTSIFKVIDRSDEITLISPSTQKSGDTLELKGRAPEIGSAGLQIEVTDSGGKTVYGPIYIRTDTDGYFSEEISVPGPGRYYAEFSDFRNNEARFITRMNFILEEPGTSEPTVAEATVSPGVSATAPTVSASAAASRNIPAYFTADTLPDMVGVSTSTGMDWRVYYTDGAMSPVRVDDAGSTAPEEFTVTTSGGPLYLKVEPVRAGDAGTVTLTVNNVESLTNDPSAATHFGDAIPESEPTESPFPLLVLIFALCGVGWASIRK
ncbi:hypothetical protein [Methanogenium organophilum]|uniref:Uncharacterized protein n=1 Tax=Methanogenium organophilum TaxID=2199 RepID=A0A9X9S324_METOG|nr:hypothetical protein [Methanogenium organophilum]WAI00888.1 hypothetical protein OU421_10765 [Methanogenium organophilum]